MMKNKFKILLIVLITAILCLSVGAYAAYTLTAKDVTYTKPDGTTVSVKEALDELREKIGSSSAVETTMAEAQSNDMLTRTKNSLVEDAYGNKIVVPAGFKITGDATTVDKGIAIIDSNQNEFVWIPTGTIHTNTQKTASETIKLERYDFSSDGTESLYSSSSFQERTTSAANTTAKRINDFIVSAVVNRGFYIGRYEARTGRARSAKTDALTTLTTKSSDYVYNYVTQIQAANLARNMYQDATTFTSDLMNSYAWDTATLFLQTCGNNTAYSRKDSVNRKLATTGTNDTTKYTGTQDVQCNVYDMASNLMEWTTESYYDDSAGPVCRGSDYDYRGRYTSERSHYNTAAKISDSYIGFRPLLYL